MNNALLIDIGGTNMRYAIVKDVDDDLSEINKLPFNQDNFDSFIKKIIDNQKINILIISIAGPKIDNSISMTNRDFSFDADVIKKKFKLDDCILLNDWEAIAYSYPYISNSINFIKEGTKFNNTKLFFGPGTGLGASLSIDNNIVLPTEVGNTTNSSLSLQKNYNVNLEDHITLESLVSGSAISSIYKSLVNKDISSEEIYEKFVKKEEIATEVINGFLKSLAETLSDLALTFLPGDGILLAGSLMRRIFHDINIEEFNNTFLKTKSNTHQVILEKISIGVITKERTPLYGNFYLFKTKY